MNCWHCNTELIWGGDHDTEDNEDYDIVSNLSCPKCHAAVDVWHPSEKLIKEYAASIKLDENFKSNSGELEKISHKLAFFKEQTTNKFKNYQSKVSAQTKMHQAYKKYSG